MPEPIDRLAVSPAEAAEALSITRAHLYHLMERGELPSVKLGRSRRIRVSDLKALLEGGADDAAAT
jgi:excisionase family DNA binding protein